MSGPSGPFPRASGSDALALLLAPWSFRFAVPIGGQAASSHLELPAPEDLLIARSTLERVSERPTEPTGATVATELTGSSVATELAHLHPKPQPRDALVFLTVDFALRASGVLSAALLISALTSLMLLAGVLLHFLGGIPVRADAAGAVVVVAPAVFAPFVTASASHRLVRRVVSTLRVLVVVAAAISFGAAASLVAAFPHQERRWIWVGLFVLSLVPTVVLWLGWRRSARIERTASLV